MIERFTLYDVHREPRRTLLNRFISVGNPEGPIYQITHIDDSVYHAIILTVIDDKGESKKITLTGFGTYYFRKKPVDWENEIKTNIARRKIRMVVGPRVDHKLVSILYDSLEKREVYFTHDPELTGMALVGDDAMQWLEDKLGNIPAVVLYKEVCKKA